MEQTSPSTAPTDEAKMTTDPLPKHFRPLVSSQLRAMAWLDPNGEDALADKNVDLGLLVIIFSTGSWYGYKDMPRVKAQGLLDAPSVGKFFGAQIKSKPDEHPFSKFTDELVAHMKAKK